MQLVLCNPLCGESTSSSSSQRERPLNAVCVGGYLRVIGLGVRSGNGPPSTNNNFEGACSFCEPLHAGSLAGDLGFHLQQKGVFRPEMAQYYTARTILGIRHLHQQGIVYRDLKPENVMLDEYGRSRISDMGLACKVTPHLTGACGTRGCEIPSSMYSIPGKMYG